LISLVIGFTAITVYGYYSGYFQVVGGSYITNFEIEDVKYVNIDENKYIDIIFTNYDPFPLNIKNVLLNDTFFSGKESEVMKSLLYFNGTNIVDVPYNEKVYDFSKEFSIAFWLKGPTPWIDPIKTIMQWGFGDRSWEIRVSPSPSEQYRATVNVYVSRDGQWGEEHVSGVWSSDFSYSENWVHIVVAYKYVSNKFSELKIYVNGELKGNWNDVIGPLFKSPLPIRMGEAYLGFKGLIYGIHIYNRTLTPTDVALSYLGGCAKDGLVGEWMLDEGEGNVIRDTSGNGNNGTIHGTTWVQARTPKGQILITTDFQIYRSLEASTDIEPRKRYHLILPFNWQERSTYRVRIVPYSGVATEFTSQVKYVEKELLSNNVNVTSSLKSVFPVSAGETFHPCTESSALSFDGVDDYVEVPHSHSLNMPSEMTIEAWIKLNEVVQMGSNPDQTVSWVIVSKNLDPFELRIHADRIGYEHRTVSESSLKGYGSTVLQTGKWYYVAWTYDGSVDGDKLYVNGVQETVTKYARQGYGGEIKTNNYRVTIGQRDPYYMRFNGTIDELRISNVSRSASEIFANWNRGQGMYLEADNHTVALWHFDEGEGNIVHDETLNGNHGSIKGASWVAGVYLPSKGIFHGDLVLDRGDWSIKKLQLKWNGSIILNGNATLRLDNTTIDFIQKEDGLHCLNLDAISFLDCYDSRITAMLAQGSSIIHASNSSIGRLELRNRSITYLVDTTYDLLMIFQEAKSVVSQCLNVQVVDKFGEVVPSANVNLTCLNIGTVYTGLTNVNGSAKFVLPEKTITASGISSYGNYSLNVSFGGKALQKTIEEDRDVKIVISWLPPEIPAFSLFSVFATVTLSVFVVLMTIDRKLRNYFTME
jgi:hypothetical protein